MNIDERLEALTHSVELLASFHKDNEARMDKMTEAITKLTDAMTVLANTMVNHEGRIDGLEGKS